MLESGRNITVELRSEQSKKMLAEALIDLMQKKDFASIKIQNITDRAGLSHMAYYRNFSCKEEIIRYYLDVITNKFTKNSQFSYKADDFRKYILDLFTHLTANRNLGLLLYRNSLIHYVKDEFDKIFTQNAATTVEKYNRYFISGGLYNTYYYWLINGCMESAEELANMFMSFSYPKKEKGD